MQICVAVADHSSQNKQPMEIKGFAPKATRFWNGTLELYNKHKDCDCCCGIFYLLILARYIDNEMCYSAVNCRE